MVVVKPLPEPKKVEPRQTDDTRDGEAKTMIKLIATILAATGVFCMEGNLHAQTSLVQTPRLHISEDSEMMARRTIRVEPITGLARMVAVCGTNGDVWIGFAVDATSDLGRPLPRIRIVSENGSGRFFDAHLVKPDDATILFFAAPTHMRMKQRRPTEFIERMALSQDFGVVLGFSESDVEASFEGHMVALAALYISAFCDFDPLN